MAKILIVEDNALNIKLFCDLLAAHGHDRHLGKALIGANHADEFKAADMGKLDVGDDEVGREVLRGLQRPSRRNQRFWLHVQCFGDGDQVRLVRLEKPQKRREQRRLSRPRPQLIRPDSGQVKEPPRPPFVGNRGCERKKGDCPRVIWLRNSHGLSLGHSSGSSVWQGS